MSVDGINVLKKIVPPSTVGVLKTRSPCAVAGVGGDVNKDVNHPSIFVASSVVPS